MHTDLRAGRFKLKSSNSFDTVIIGAGASGLMCAATAGRRGRKVLLTDHSSKTGKKILISGGGKCNFTNLSVEPENYISDNPHFCRSAISRYTQFDFIDFLAAHGIAYEEREEGRLFCTESAGLIVDLLFQECTAAGVRIITGCEIKESQIIHSGRSFKISTSRGDFTSEKLVIASGGPAWPQAGATDFGHRIAERFGHSVVPCRPGLVPLIFNKQDALLFEGLQGISLNAEISYRGKSFKEAVLFTHTGISGPAVLQISNYWKQGETLSINFLPDTDISVYIEEWKQHRPKAELKNLLSTLLPGRLAERLLKKAEISGIPATLRSENRDAVISMFQSFSFIPAGTAGFKASEVTAGGIDTSGISSKTFESNIVPGLHFIGEVLDVTGELGGYNLQWAWSSGYCAGEYV